MAVQELETWIPRRELGPQLPDAEAALAHVGVVEQHHRAARELRRPALEIGPHLLVGVAAVDVQQVERALGEIRQRLVEGAAQQFREAGIARVVEAAQRAVDLLAIEPGVRVTLPGIDCVAPGLELLAQHRFAERRIGDAVMGPELDD